MRVEWVLDAVEKKLALIWGAVHVLPAAVNRQVDGVARMIELAEDGAVLMSPAGKSE